MNIERLMTLTGMLPYFDLQALAQLSGEPRHTLRVQLCRWVKRGKIVPLRRGMYAFGARYRHHPISAATLANTLLSPSYLSFQWALGYHGLIPERVVTYTSATTRSPRTFQNEFGKFRYKHIKKDFFFGYEAVEVDHHRAQVAMPEKALLDFWHSEPGEWTEERMESMRFQGFAAVSQKRLEAFAERWDSPRLMRAVVKWKAFVKTETKGIKML
jgi:predicted transcriptional regulator of viral defense system